MVVTDNAESSGETFLVAGKTASNLHKAQSTIRIQFSSRKTVLLSIAESRLHWKREVFRPKLR